VIEIERMTGADSRHNGQDGHKQPPPHGAPDARDEVMALHPTLGTLRYHCKFNRLRSPFNKRF
jgi:hypothetical protein